MKRFLILSFFLGFTMAFQAQVQVADKELRCLVESIVSLRQSDSTKMSTVVNTVSANLSADKKWTIMDELKDQNNGECFLTKKMNRFNLNPILNRVLSVRNGKNKVAGHFLNGEDSRYDYSLIEKGIKAKKKVKYTFKGRVGKQDFVIIPYVQDANLSVKFSRNSTNLKTSIRKEKNGCIYLHTDAKLKATDNLTLEVENGSNMNVAIAIINHNTRK